MKTKFVISYYEIQSDHILEIPEFFRSEFVEANSYEDVEKYILYSKYQKANDFTKKNLGFDFTSNTGAVKIEKYVPPVPPKFKSI